MKQLKKKTNKMKEVSVIKAAISKKCTASTYKNSTKEPKKGSYLSMPRKQSLEICPCWVETNQECCSTDSNDI